MSTSRKRNKSGDENAPILGKKISKNPVPEGTVRKMLIWTKTIGDMEGMVHLP